MENYNKPILYSKTALILFSPVSSFISGILYVSNLRTLGKKKYYLAMILYAIFAPGICINVLKYAGIPFPVTYLPVNFLCGYLLTSVFWNYQIVTTDYKKRSVLIPLLITLGIIVLFSIISFIKFHEK
jgi:hypothetical protein